MQSICDLDGLRFAYPSTWELTQEQRDDGLAVMVSSSGTAFCSIMLMPERPSVDSVLRAALAAFRESYDDADSEPVSCRLASRPARGYDIDFFCLELVNSAWLRAFRTPQYTVFVLFQAGFDEPHAREIFESICNSLDCKSVKNPSPFD